MQKKNPLFTRGCHWDWKNTYENLLFIKLFESLFCSKSSRQDLWLSSKPICSPNKRDQACHNQGVPLPGSNCMAIVHTFVFPENLRNVSMCIYLSEEANRKGGIEDLGKGGNIWKATCLRWADASQAQEVQIGFDGGGPPSPSGRGRGKEGMCDTSRSVGWGDGELEFMPESSPLLLGQRELSSG